MSGCSNEKMKFNKEVTRKSNRAGDARGPWCMARAHTTAASGLVADVSEHARIEAGVLSNGRRGNRQELIHNEHTK